MSYTPKNYIKQTDDRYLTVVSLCKGYRRRQERIERASLFSAQSDPVLANDIFLNRLIYSAISMRCYESWLIPYIIDSIGDMIGFRNFIYNAMVSKHVFERWKKEAIWEIARKLSLI
ncbi:MAG: hypothetical protein IKB34_02005 [Clostridia bacterium]|nr:hypothetical protein [Clostridia bacterium]